MISIILKWTGDWTAIQPGFYFNHTPINEMTDGHFLVTVFVPDHFDTLETMLEAQTNVTVIGTYNADGSPYLWGNEVSRNHTPEKWRGALRNKYDVSYDPDTGVYTVTDAGPHSEAEGNQKQVTKVAGTDDYQIT